MNIGEILDMNVVRLETNEYGSRFILKYGERETYRAKAFDFQTEGDHPSTIRVRVTGIDPMSGFPQLVQDNKWVLEQSFEHSDLIGRNYEFEVYNKKIDPNTKASYLCLKDDFGIRFHRYYTNEDYSVGDRIRLHIKELKNGYLDLVKPEERTKISGVNSLVFTTRDNITAATIPTPTIEYKQLASGKEYVFEDNESLKLEYKSSIVFDSDSSLVNVDKQLSKILRSIAGFMNAEGGTLYIGVNKNGFVRGVEGDFKHLNEGSVDFDEYYNQYFKNIDGFENKIRNCVSQHLSSLAGALFTFDTECHNGKTVAKICVNKASSPILYNGQVIYQRQGNSTRALRNNELVYFCATKWFGSENALKPQEDAPKKKGAVTADCDNEARDNSLWHTFNLHKDGGWSFDENAEGILDDVIMSCDIEKFREKENHRILISYNSGNLSVLAFDDVKQVNNKNEVRVTNPKWLENVQGYGVNGYNTHQGLQNVCCANPMDMVAVFYEKENRSYVKVVDLSNISVQQTLGAKGNQIVPSDVENCKIFHLHHKYHDMLRGLTRKSDKSSPGHSGYDMDNDAKVRPIIQKLQEILREEYGVTFE